ncbi:hypothetical protein [Rhodoflexus caldus]|uniref:hypothetical protein n=1 Tax=Rhodoflexus caldus TaxID=2891236 RepID=UPI002029DA08|nr:hypothetical protein [Rhodoflexus caldus]
MTTSALANVSQMNALFKVILPDGTRLSVSADGKKLLTEGYTSNAGNTYFAAISLTNDFVIKEDIGQGWKYTFLNGLKIYTRNNQLIAERSFHYRVYSEEAIAHEAAEMLTEAIMDAAKRQKIQVNRAQIENEVRTRLDATQRLK